MTPLYVYAVLGDAPSGRLGSGVAGERIRAIRAGDVVVAVGDVAAPPAIDPATLRSHDATVRRLARRARAILPARFGSLVPDEPALARLLDTRAAALREALALVENREQMTLRVYGERAARDAPPAARVDTRGPGTRYLDARLRADRGEREAPEIGWLRPALAQFVVAERVQRHDEGVLIASVYHLIARGRSRAYLDAIATATRRPRAVRVTASGPWAPYAFAPETGA